MGFRELIFNFRGGGVGGWVGTNSPCPFAVLLPYEICNETMLMVRGAGWGLRVGKGGVVFAFGYNLVSLAIVNVI